MQILLILLFAHSAFVSGAPDPYDEEFESKLQIYELKYQEDNNICRNINFKQKTDCWKVNEQFNLKEEFECCHRIPTNSDESPGCYLGEKAMIKVYMQPKYYAMFYEGTGYYSAASGEFWDLDYYNGNFTCSSGNYESVPNVQFTDEEKAVFLLPNHCLNYHNKSIYKSQKVTKNECFNAALLDSTKKVGITCGYFEFNFTYEGKEMNLNTCYFVNLDLIKAGSFDYDERTSFDEIVVKYIYQENLELHLENIDLIKIPPYTFKAYSDEKSVAFYNSTSNSFVELTSEAKPINISKLLILIFLLLLL